VLDQHKEKSVRDATIQEKFYSYNFADHKDGVIALLGRVVRVSVDTMTILAQLGKASTVKIEP
jgi:predicted helicase